ncbi:hypothetical protein [Fodinicurvata sp. EGI_FJ10296]|jgi:hypothetical protein
MILQIVLIVALIAVLFPKFRRRLKGFTGLVFAAVLLFIFVATLAQ